MQEQYTRTKGVKTIVLDEIPSRNRQYSPVKYDRRYREVKGNMPDKLPLWMWRLLTQMVETRDKPRHAVLIHHHHRQGLPWGKIKLVLTTLIAAPIVFIELGFLLRFLFER